LEGRPRPVRKLAGIIALVVAMLMVAAACGGGGGALGEITAADGRYTITKVEVGDRFPPDCSGYDCLILEPVSGEEAVTVRLEPQFKAPESGLDEPCVGEHTIYIVTDDGSRGSCVAFSTTSRAGEEGVVAEVALVFAPPASTKGFTLFVPDNPPIDLGK
jgi:hypothetical protein